MDSSRVIGSQSNGYDCGADFVKLACDLDIPGTLLKSALDDAADVMRD